MGELATTQGQLPATQGENAWALVQRKAKALASSDLVPDTYKGNVSNCIIALNISDKVGCDPLMVCQNLHIIHGRPSWSSSFIVAAINGCGRFSPLRYEVEGDKMDMRCRAWAYDLENGERIDGPWVSMEMAQAEGWLSKKGSKWQTMPELMIRYRAASFFGRLFAPDILMGMHMEDEVRDYTGPDRAKDITPETSPIAMLNKTIAEKAEAQTIDAEPEAGEETTDAIAEVLPPLDDEPVQEQAVQPKPIAISKNANGNMDYNGWCEQMREVMAMAPTLEALQATWRTNEAPRRAIAMENRPLIDDLDRVYLRRETELKGA